MKHEKLDWAKEGRLKKAWKLVIIDGKKAEDLNGFEDLFWTNSAQFFGFLENPARFCSYIFIKSCWGWDWNLLCWTDKEGYKSIYRCVFFRFFRTFVSISSGGLHCQKWCYWWVQLGNPVLMSAKNVVGLLFLFFSFFFSSCYSSCHKIVKEFRYGWKFYPTYGLFN